MEAAAGRIKPVSFVNRKKEIEFIEEKKLRDLERGDSLFQFLILVSGIPGIGKTTLLEKIMKTAESRNLRTLMISLGKNLSSKEKKRFHVLKQMAGELFEKKAARGICDKIDSIISMDEDRRREFLKGYLKELIDILNQHPVVLLIDDSHRIDAAEREILEKIMERVCRKNRLLVILAGRSDLRWRSFELRRRSYRIRLEHFPEKEKGDLIPEPGDKQVSGRIYRLARGYPLASVQAIEWINDNLEMSGPELHRQLNEKETDMVLFLSDTILRKFILIDVPGDENQSQLEFLLKTVSPLRRFDDGILCGLLKMVKPDEYESLDTREAYSHIREMSAMTHLVTWNSRKHAYSIDIAIRKLLALAMKYKHGQRLMKIHSHMTQFYGEEMEKAIDNDPSAPQSVLYLIEYIYHLVSHSLLKEGEDIPVNEIKDAIGKNFKTYKHREKNHFYEEFRKDRELSELLGAEAGSIIGYVKKEL